MQHHYIRPLARGVAGLRSHPRSSKGAFYARCCKRTSENPPSRHLGGVRTQNSFVEYLEPLRGRSILSRKRGRSDDGASSQVENKAIPEWAQGLYYNSGLIKEVLVYHDDEAIYFEHRGKESGIVRFTFKMIEGLKIVEEEEAADSKE
jgi:hypothetical protein